MRTEVYTCDICKQSKSKGDLSNMDIHAQVIRLASGPWAKPIHFDICKDCLKKHGFIVNPKESEVSEDEAEKHNEATLKNKILDILTDLDVQFYE